jgi:hypothetical protein
MDQLLRHFAGERTARVRAMAGTAILWIAGYVFLLRPFCREFIASVNVHQGFRAVLTSCALSVYTLFVSESVAPWHWQLSVPAGLAVLVCIVLIFIFEPGPSRRFLVYGVILLILMGVTGTLLSRRLFFVAPWVLLPIAVAMGSIKSRWARPVLALTLLMVGGIGWSGIYMRRFYSAPQFLESWVQVAGDAAGKIQTGATVISNSRPFFFYLTYALRTPTSGSESKFDGLFPDSIHQPNVTTTDQWFSSGHLIVPVMIWIRGVSNEREDKPMAEDANELDRGCGSRVSRLMMRDDGFAWKQRFLSETVGQQWRIEVREYDCTPSSSQEIFHIPAQ